MAADDELRALLQNMDPSVRDENARMLGVNVNGKRPCSRTSQSVPTASEHDEQAALFGWAAMIENQVPELALLFAVPNGGLRHVVVAKQMKAEGLKAGVPDVWLPVPRNGRHGLVIEMKIDGNTTSSKQDWWLATLRDGGYETHVCYGFEEARTVIENYLGM